jgi:Lrp/AsnC family transcriptional regulator for asnA, asnC and gidA
MSRDGRHPNGPFEITPLDLEIFRELQRDGRTPFVAIADRLGVSEAHVRRRTARLTEAQVFSITAVADPKVFGVDCMAWLGIRAHESHATAVAESLVAQPEIDYVVQTAGAYNVMAEAACRSSAELYRLLRRIRDMPGVQRTETFVYLNLLRQQFQWSLDGARQGVHARGDFQLDPLDIELVSDLQRDGRASFRDIARRLRVSERTVSARVSRMVEANLLQVIAVGNPLTLGFSAMAWLGIRVAEGTALEDAASALADVHGIDYVVLPTGRYDLMAEIVCTDQTQLLEILEQGVGAIPGIASVETFLYLRLLYASAVGAWGASRSLAIGHTGREHPPAEALP